MTDLRGLSALSTMCAMEMRIVGSARVIICIGLMAGLGCAQGEECNYVTATCDAPVADGIDGPDPVETGPQTQTPGPVEVLPPKPPAIASGIDIFEIALYQGVKILLAQEGAPVLPSAPIIENRAALLRVFVRPQEEFQSRDLRAELDLVRGEEVLQTLASSLFVRVASSDAVRESTFNFNIDADRLGFDVEYRIRIYEVGDVQGAPSAGAVFPSAGNAAFGALTSPSVLKVVLVPFRYQADGSGRLPDLSEAQLGRYRKLLTSRYPVSEVQFTVRDAVDWQETVAPRSSAGFSSFLEGLLNIRQSDRVADDVYYYGVISPARDFPTFCGRGCVSGLSSLVRDGAPAYFRGSVGLGFSGAGAAETMAHELGHAHGRGHAPCGTRDVDRAYPYAGGEIGTWGYDILSDKLYAPDTADMMGYCDPQWISDYTYGAIFDRMELVNRRPALVTEATPQVWRSVRVGPEGVGPLSAPMRFAAPGRPDRRVTLLDAQGATIADAGAYFAPFAEGEGGIMLVPEGTETPHAVVIDGTTRYFD